jgi:hypothetical protein
MQPFAAVTEKDTLSLVGPVFLTDLIWRHYFGRSIEYRHRIIPTRLCYLRSKYGAVIPHEFFVEDIQYSCAEYKSKRNSGEAELVCLSAEKAGRLIEEAGRLGLITAYTSSADKRYKLWRLTEVQKQKLYDIREAVAQIDDIIEAQMKDPHNPLAGRNEVNQKWHGNVVTDRLRREDETFIKDKNRLARLQYLIAGIFIGIITAAILLAPVLAMADSAGSPK